MKKVLYVLFIVAVAISAYGLFVDSALAGEAPAMPQAQATRETARTPRGIERPRQAEPVDGEEAVSPQERTQQALPSVYQDSSAGNGDSSSSSSSED